MLPIGHAERMEEIRDIAANYSLQNIYNEDGSGLLFRMGPNHTYLLREEDRSSTRGTSLQKQKHRLTVVFCTNADGSHIFCSAIHWLVCISNSFPWKSECQRVVLVSEVNVDGFSWFRNLAEMVVIEHLPANTTATNQSLNQGLITVTHPFSPFPLFLYLSLPFNLFPFLSFDFTCKLRKIDSNGIALLLHYLRCLVHYLYSRKQCMRYCTG